MKKFILSLFKFTNPIINLPNLLFSVPRYYSFIKDYNNYKKLDSKGELMWKEVLPNIHEKDSTHELDAHYFFQSIWALSKIRDNSPKKHVDVGSQTAFAGTLSVTTEVDFVDLRELHVNLPRFNSIKGSILDLPYSNNSVSSLSCLHVVEHIGLGRYGDPLNPEGSKLACKELSRILAVGGDLYLSLPIGRPRICFNAHRIHSPSQILEYFKDLTLIEFSGVDDQGNYLTNVSMDILKDASYACGMFHFRK